MGIKLSPSKRGFTIVELVLGIVVMGIAISGILSAFYSFNKASLDPIFEVKAAMLADQVINRVYKTDFDENSDHNSGECRCDEKYFQYSEDESVIAICDMKDCKLSKGADTDLEKTAKSPAYFNDVGDFDTLSLCENNSSLSCITNQDLCANGKNCLIPASFFTDENFDKWMSGFEQTMTLYDSHYNGFYVYISVDVSNKEKTVNTKKSKSIIESPSNHQYFAQMKRIKVAILAPNGSLYNFKFLRGNY